MKKHHWKEFLLRGALFGGLGCIVVAVVCLIISLNGVQLGIGGLEFFCATVSGYVVGFVVAGASVFYQVESWGLARATLLHLLLLYFAYLGMYLLNNWLPRDRLSVGIFTGVFVLGYLVIWAVVVASITVTARRLNEKIKKTDI
jgi:hypothetical protein